MLWFAGWITNSHWRFIESISLQRTMPSAQRAAAVACRRWGAGGCCPRARSARGAQGPDRCQARGASRRTGCGLLRRPAPTGAGFRAARTERRGRATRGSIQHQAPSPPRAEAQSMPAVASQPPCRVPCRRSAGLAAGEFWYEGEWAHDQRHGRGAMRGAGLRRRRGRAAPRAAPPALGSFENATPL